MTHSFCCSLQLLILLSATNIALPFRNVLYKGKSLEKNENANQSLRQKFVVSCEKMMRMNIGSWLIVLCIAVVFLGRLPNSSQELNFLLLLSAHRAFYELASLLVLGQVSVVFHGILDVTKRTAITGLDMVFLSSEDVRPYQVVGGAMTFLGLALYNIRKGRVLKEFKEVSPGVAKLILRALIACLLITSSLSIRFYVQQGVA